MEADQKQTRCKSEAVQKQTESRPEAKEMQTRCRPKLDWKQTKSRLEKECKICNDSDLHSSDPKILFFVGKISDNISDLLFLLTFAITDIIVNPDRKE